MKANGHRINVQVEAASRDRAVMADDADGMAASARLPQSLAPLGQAGAARSDQAARLDELCELAAIACTAPAAGIFVVTARGDVESRWSGWVGPDVPFERTPAAIVQASGEAVAIPDLDADERFAEAVARGAFGRFRGFAGVPVAGDGERPSGVLCVFAEERGALGCEQLRALELVAAQARRELAPLDGAGVPSSAPDRDRSAWDRLERDRERLLAIMDAAPDALLVVDENQRIAVINDALLRLASIDARAQDFVGMPFDDITEQWLALLPDPAAALDRIKQISAARVPIHGEQVRLVDGRVFERDYSPIVIGEEPRGELWHFRDITAERIVADKLSDSQARTAAERARLAHVIADALDAIVTFDGRGRIVELNPAAERLFGISLDEAGELEITALYSGDDPDHVIAATKPPRIGELLGRRYETTLRDANGRSFDAEISLSVASHSGGLATAFVRDISAAKLADMEREKRLRLERTARRAAEKARADLETRNAELRSLSEEKDSFVASVSHELRTPLTAISTFTGLLRDGDQASPTDRDALAVIDRNVTRLQSLVADLLLLKRGGDAVTVSVEDVDVQALLEETAEEMVSAARSAEVALEAERSAALTVLADRERLGQALRNLVDNAIKFTPPGGHVRLAARSSGDRAEIEVTDTGIGIAPKHLHRIFEPFYQPDAGATRGGVGLGLAIARTLVEAQDGSLEASSVPGSGSSFVIDLPTPAR